MRTILRIFCGLAVLGYVVLSTGSAAAASVTLVHSNEGNSIKTDVIATNLNNPRGIAIGRDGRVYVAEAGLGSGNEQTGVGAGLGSTGSITQIQHMDSSHPSQHRLVSGLASVAAAQPGGPLEAEGPDGIAVTGEDHNVSIYTIIADHSSASQLGHLLHVSTNGQVKSLADVGDVDHSWTDQYKTAPFAPAGQFPDANPYGVVVSGKHIYVVDAGSNTLDEVLSNGQVKILAYFPNTPLSDAVPTCVALGPDGDLYIGTLALADFFAHRQGAATVYRVDPRTVDPDNLQSVLGAAKVWATGFNTITGCTIDHHGNFYAVEMFTNDVVRVPFDHPSNGRIVLGAGKLTLPGGVAVDDKGNVFVTNNTDSAKAGQGTVVRFHFSDQR